MTCSIGDIRMTTYSDDLVNGRIFPCKKLNMQIMVGAWYRKKNENFLVPVIFDPSYYQFCRGLKSVFLD